MDFLPVSLRLTGARVLLVGGGQVATRKARLLIRAGALLSVVAPAINAELEKLLADAGGTWQRGEYSEDCIGEAVLVVAATPSRAVNERVYRETVAVRPISQIPFLRHDPIRCFQCQGLPIVYGFGQVAVQVIPQVEPDNDFFWF